MTHQATPIALTIVSSKYTPLFTILALVQNAGGGEGLYTGCGNFSCDYASLLVKHDLIVCGGWEPRARQRDAPDTSGRLTSFSVEG